MTVHKKYNLPIEVLAPWSNIVLKTRIPDEVFEDLLKMYDEVMKSDWQSHGKTLVGQIDEEPKIDLEIQKNILIGLIFVFK
tara:strand:+ start:2356 stop:2598 length:243 start_codon:yes stop_codon:yes gene_type:complete